MVYLAKGGFWLALGKGFAMLSGLILTIGFANLIPKEVYRNSTFVLSLAGIIGAFTLTGMDTAVAQAVARGYEGVLKTGFWIKLKWSIFMALLMPEENGGEAGCIWSLPVCVRLVRAPQ